MLVGALMIAKLDEARLELLEPGLLNLGVVERIDEFETGLQWALLSQETQFEDFKNAPICHQFAGPRKKY